MAPQGARKPPAPAAPVARGAVQKRPRPLSALQQKLARRLSAAAFRQLNERLYTSTGAQAAALLRADPGLFAAYHAGYADQVRRWPANPLDRVLAFLAAQPAAAVVADLGCGEARLARDAPQDVVHSFDLVAANARVVACDMARTPLADSSVDVAVFCLSLMGTNYGEFLVEARRIVRPGGWVLVAEVVSRFEGQDPRAFKRAVAALGFEADDAHPFASGGGGEDGARRRGGAAGTSGGHGRLKAPAKKGRKGKRAAPKGNRFDSAPGSAAVSGGAFFVYFAFKTTKKRSGAAKACKSMPALKACVYKRR